MLNKKVVEHSGTTFAVEKEKGGIVFQRTGGVIVTYSGGCDGGGGGGGGGGGSGDSLRKSWFCMFGAEYIMIPPIICSTAATINKYAPRPKPQLTVVEPTTGNCEVAVPPIGLAEMARTMLSTWLGTP